MMKKWAPQPVVDTSVVRIPGGLLSEKGIPFSRFVGDLHRCSVSGNRVDKARNK